MTTTFKNSSTILTNNSHLMRSSILNRSTKPFSNLKISLLLIPLLLLGFQQKTKAETYYLVEIAEKNVQIAVNGLALGWWPLNFTDLVVHLNKDGSYPMDYVERVWTSGYYTFVFPYKGRAGTNTIHTTAWVGGLTPYGPYFRFNFTAPMLGRPISETATTDQINQITLLWERSSDYADGDLEYEIKEGNTSIDIVDGTIKSYTITGLGHDESHTYTITTKLKGSDRVSHPTTITGKTFGFDLTATVDKKDIVELTWKKPPDLSTEYKISRDGTNLEQVGSSLDSYLDDRTMIPGVYMKYTIEAVADASQKDNAYGRARPDGKISGSVTTPYGDPIGGVTIKIVRTDLPGDTVQKVYYATTAHDDGSYFNETIYYGADGAEFIVTPQFENHMFDPDTLTKTLSPNSPDQSGVNFKDTTALSVRGRIINKGCPAEGISVLVNGIDRGYITDADGYYAAVVSQPGLHAITPKLDGHGFIPEKYEESIVDN
ncbi:MAG: hypothetical protein ABFS10_09610, partial [Bacteroidota bacterium]